MVSKNTRRQFVSTIIREKNMYTLVSSWQVETKLGNDNADDDADDDDDGVGGCKAKDPKVDPGLQKKAQKTFSLVLNESLSNLRQPSAEKHPRSEANMIMTLEHSCVHKMCSRNTLVSLRGLHLASE